MYAAVSPFHLIKYAVVKFYKIKWGCPDIGSHICILSRPVCVIYLEISKAKVQGGSNMTGTDLCVNKPHCAAAVRP